MKDDKFSKSFIFIGAITGVCLITDFISFIIWIPVHERFQIFDSQGLHFSY